MPGLMPATPSSAEETIRQLRLLCDLAQRLSLATEEQEMYRLAARGVRQILPFIDRCSVALLESSGEHLAVFALDGDIGSIPLGKSLPQEGTMLGQTIRARAPVLIAGADFAQSTLYDLVLLRQQGLRACLDAPLITAGRVIGTLNTGSSQEGAYEEAHGVLLLQVATSLSAGIERWRMVSDLRAALDTTRRSAALIEATSDFICLVALSGQVLYINPAGMRLIGQDGDPTCFSARDIVASEYSASFDEVAAAVRAQGSWSGERYFRHRDGHVIPVDQVVTLVRDAAGQPLCLGSIAHDITQRKRTLLELQHAKEGAEAASRAKGAFLARMSHELRTPLNAVLGFTQLLCQEQDLRPTQREYLQIIRHSGEHLLALINDILQMSQIDPGRVVPRTEDSDPEREPSPRPGALMCDDLLGLPPVWHVAMRQAAVQLDLDQVEALLLEAQDIAPLGVAQIRALLRRFAFGEIQKMMEVEGS